VAGPYYYDVDMVNSALPNVARQLETAGDVV
jgi:hypothetical protein